ASTDGKTVYYLAPDAATILQVPAGGGKSKPLIEPVHPTPIGFAVTRDGIYYPAPPHSPGQRFIRFYSFSTGESRPVVLAHHTFQLGLSVSPDSRYIIFDQFDRSTSDL